MNATQDLLDQLDFYLTQTVRPAVHALNEDTEMEFLGCSSHPYYLSDGGYSRIFFSEPGELLLDSVSTDRVKEKWDDTEAVTLRQAIEEHRSNFW